ncbi:MAG: hypothetical protein OXC62_14370 [Aestuariivita sp.]|nr:hypothetical protein [Aestuariivita sp.]
MIGEGGDRDVILFCIRMRQEHDLTLCGLSHDKGFWNPVIYEALSLTLDVVALPKKGLPSAAEREQIPEFIAARQQHLAIEAAIDMLEPHGLQRVRSFSTDGFSRMVGLSIIAASLVRVGRFRRDKERVRLERARC